MPKADLPRELPSWWIGNDGSDIVMPKFRLDRNWTPTGKQVEEMIYNCMHNENYVEYQLRKYFGTTRPNDIMQKWNNDIKLYTGTDPVVKPAFVTPRSTPSWKRFHDYVVTDGVPTFHADFDLKVPIRPSQAEKFTPSSNRVRLASGLAALAPQTTEMAVPPNDLLNEATIPHGNGGSTCSSAAQKAEFMLDILSGEQLAELKNGKAYVRKRSGKFLPQETAILHENAGRNAEQRRKSEAVPNMVVTAEEYAANGIPFLDKFPTAQLDWADNPNKIILVDSMEQIGDAYENALVTLAMAPSELQAVRLVVEQEVAALYQDNRESEEERNSKLKARAGLYLLREMASKLKYQLIFEKHCEEAGSARNGTNQRLQAMSDTVLAAITEWLAQNHKATREEKARLDLGYLTYTSLLDTLHDLLQVADPESHHGGGFAKRGRLASDSALLLSTTKVLDDIFRTNNFTFPLAMRKQPPSYENIPAWPSPEEKGLPVSKRSKTGRSSKGMRKEVSTEVAGGEGIGKISGEQDAHLDGLTDAIFTVTNLTRGKGYIGVALRSAGFIHPLKKLAREEFVPFRREFNQFPCPGDPEERKLIDVMPGSDARLKLRAAWRVYAVCRLSQQGIDVRPWKRAYIEMAEGVTAICSMSQLHFGTRFPLYFDNRPVPNDLWHLRLHMYVGSKLRPRLEGETGALLDQVQDSTVDIYDHREDSDWISAAQHCYGLAGIEY